MFGRVMMILYDMVLRKFPAGQINMCKKQHVKSDCTKLKMPKTKPYLWFWMMKHVAQRIGLKEEQSQKVQAQFLHNWTDHRRSYRSDQDPQQVLRIAHQDLAEGGSTMTQILAHIQPLNGRYIQKEWKHLYGEYGLGILVQIQLSSLLTGGFYQECSQPVITAINKLKYKHFMTKSCHNM